MINCPHNRISNMTKNETETNLLNGCLLEERNQWTHARDVNVNLYRQNTSVMRPMILEDSQGSHLGNLA